MSRRKKVM